jgi:uncharacterized protein
MPSITALTLVPGAARAASFVLSEPLSFWGGVAPENGCIIDRSHPQRGKCVTGAVLVMDEGRGSSSSSSVLAEMIRLGTGPAGIVLRTPDAILTIGAMVAGELYGRWCPVVAVQEDDWSATMAATVIGISAQSCGGAAILEFPE